MANCKRCDRCGWCYDKVEHGSSILRLQIYSTGETIMDLCDECTSKLVDWLKEFKKDDKVKEERHD